jgi:hypothetical protein
MRSVSITKFLTLVAWASAQRLFSGGREDFFDEHPRLLKSIVQPQQSVDVNELVLNGDASTLTGTPTNALPRHYNLTLEIPPAGGKSFSARVIIDMDIVEDSSRIFLHGDGILVSNCTMDVMFKNGTAVQLYVLTNLVSNPSHRDAMSEKEANN